MDDLSWGSARCCRGVDRCRGVGCLVFLCGAFTAGNRDLLPRDGHSIGFETQKSCAGQRADDRVAAFGRLAHYLVCEGVRGSFMKTVSVV